MLNLHGCELVTALGIHHLSSLTNLRELNLELCRAATGLDTLTGTQLASTPCCSSDVISMHVCSYTIL